MLPGNKLSATAQVMLIMDSRRFPVDCLHQGLKWADYDFILIDTSAAMGLFQEAALYTAEGLIVPSTLEDAALEGVGALLDTLQSVQSRGGRCKWFNILPTRYAPVTPESSPALVQLIRRYDERVFLPIYEDPLLQAGVTAGATIWELAPDSRAAIEYERVVQELLTDD